MKTLVTLNANFSSSPGAVVELIDPMNAKITKGTLYVNTEGATGVGSGNGVKVVGTVDGAVIVQASRSVELIKMSSGVKADFMPSEKPQGTSRATGTSNRDQAMKQLSAGR